MKIVVLDGYTMNPGDLGWAALEAFGDVVVYDDTPPELFAQRAADADIVLTNKTPIKQNELGAMKRVKYIGLMATGFDRVDVAAAKQMGIPVCNIPGYATTSVAQTVFALLLEIAHNTSAYDRAVKNGEWEDNLELCCKLPLFELAGLTMGIVGFGGIGRKTAQIARAFDMNVLASTGYPDEREEGIDFVSMDELLTRADVISLHKPLNAQTRGMIDSKAIAKMKDGVILINTARGALIDEAALREALCSGKVAAAGLDVVAVEPMRADSVLHGAKNTVITPHIGWAPRQARARALQMSADNLKAFLDGKTQNCVNGL